jgi:hypothetical protein
MKRLLFCAFNMDTGDAGLGCAIQTVPRAAPPRKRKAQAAAPGSLRGTG